MRTLIGVLVVAAVIGGFITHRHKAETPNAAAAPVSTRASPARQTSEHDWAKNALDRAAEVKRQVATQRKENATVEGN